MQKIKHRGNPVSLPGDWKQQVETYIQNRAFPFLPGINQPERRQREMRRLLQTSEVEAAADIMWKAAKNRPALQGGFHCVIHGALFDLTRALLFVPSIPTRRFHRDVIKVLEYVRDNNRRFRKGEALLALERSISDYHMDEEEAPATRPKEPGPRIALIALQDRFKEIYGRPMNKAVGYFLKAAFPTTDWNTTTVGARAKEINRQR